MIYYITIDNLLYSKKEKIEKDRAAVYDLTVKDIVRATRRYVYQYKWLGHSVVFKHKGVHKILIHNN